MQEQINKKEADLKQARVRLQQLEAKAKRTEDLEKELATAKTLHAQEIARLHGQLQSTIGQKRDSQNLFSPTEKL